MEKILIVSGPLIALFDKSDLFHRQCVEFIKNTKANLITTIASVTETLHLLDFNRNAQLDFLEWASLGAIEVYPIENRDFFRIKELINKYKDLPMDFADACLVLLAEKLNLNKIATIDSDFTIYRIKGKQKFQIVLKYNK